MPRVDEPAASNNSQGGSLYFDAVAAAAGGGGGSLDRLSISNEVRNLVKTTRLARLENEQLQVKYRFRLEALQRENEALRASNTGLTEQVEEYRTVLDAVAVERDTLTTNTNPTSSAYDNTDSNHNNNNNNNAAAGDITSSTTVPSSEQTSSLTSQMHINVKLLSENGRLRQALNTANAQIERAAKVCEEAANGTLKALLLSALGRNDVDNPILGDSFVAAPSTVAKPEETPEKKDDVLQNEFTQLQDRHENLQKLYDQLYSIYHASQKSLNEQIEKLAEEKTTFEADAARCKVQAENARANLDAVEHKYKEKSRMYLEEFDALKAAFEKDKHDERSVWIRKLELVEAEKIAAWNKLSEVTRDFQKYKEDVDKIRTLNENTMAHMKNAIKKIIPDSESGDTVVATGTGAVASSESEASLSKRNINDPDAQNVLVATAELELYKTQYDTDVTVLQNEITKLKSANMTLEHQMIELRNTLIPLDEHLALKNTLIERDQAIRNRETLVIAKDLLIKSSRDEAAAFKLELAKQVDEKRGVSAAFRKFRENNENKNKIIEGWKLRHDDLLAQKHHLEARIKAIGNSEVRKEAQIQSLKALLEKRELEVKMQTLRAEDVDDLRQSSKRFKADLARKDGYIETLKKKLEELANVSVQKEVFRDSIEHQHSKYEELTAEKQRLETRLAYLKREHDEQLRRTIPPMYEFVETVFRLAAYVIRRLEADARHARDTAAKAVSEERGSKSPTSEGLLDTSFIDPDLKKEVDTISKEILEIDFATLINTPECVLKDPAAGRTSPSKASRKNLEAALSVFDKCNEQLAAVATRTEKTSAVPLLRLASFVKDAASAIKVL